MSRKRTTILAVIMGLAMSFFVGCTGEEGAQAGVINGVSAAVAALIKAPVDAFIKQNFS